MKNLAFATVVLGLAVAALTGVLSLPAHAQEKPGTLLSVEEQTPKFGAVKQYEDGRKQLAAWRASKKDPTPLVVFEQVTGDKSGTYYVSSRWLHWADLDKPAVPLQESTEEYVKVMGDSVVSVVPRLYEEHPELAYNGPEGTSMSNEPPKYLEIYTFHVKLGHRSQFVDGVNRVRQAFVNTKSPGESSWFELAEGGDAGTWVLSISHDTWADFDNPASKPLPVMLKDAFGPEATESIFGSIDNAVSSFTLDVLMYRPDLSYLPAK